MEKAKNDLKARLQAMHDRDISALDNQLLDLTNNGKRRYEELEEKHRYLFDSKKAEMES